MRTIATIILLITSSASISQRLIYNEESVDTIHIQAEESAYSFDDNRTTQGTSSILSISFDTLKQSYEVNTLLHREFLISKKDDSVRVENHDKVIDSSSSIDVTKLTDLLNELSNNKATESLINQIDLNTFKEHVTEKRIMGIAKKRKVRWYFKRRYSSKLENEKFFESCKSIDTFNVYLNTRFTNSGYSIVTDYSRHFNIWIITNKSTHRFEGKYPNPFLQPWYKHENESSEIEKSLINLNINLSLAELVPNDFTLIDSITLEALYEDYISWYFDRREIK